MDIRKHISAVGSGYQKFGPEVRQQRVQGFRKINNLQRGLFFFIAADGSRAFAWGYERKEFNQMSCIFLGETKLELSTGGTGDPKLFATLDANLTDQNWVNIVTWIRWKMRMGSCAAAVFLKTRIQDSRKDRSINFLLVPIREEYWEKKLMATRELFWNRNIQELLELNKDDANHQRRENMDSTEEQQAKKTESEKPLTFVRFDKAQFSNRKFGVPVASFMGSRNGNLKSIYFNKAFVSLLKGKVFQSANLFMGSDGVTVGIQFFAKDIPAQHGHTVSSNWKKTFRGGSLVHKEVVGLSISCTHFCEEQGIAWNKDLIGKHFAIKKEAPGSHDMQNFYTFRIGDKV